MKIALATAGSRGDVHPVLALGRSLTEHGHEVRVCATVDFEDDVHASGLAFRPVGSSVRSLLERNARAIHAGPRATLEACRDELRALFDEQFSALPGAIEGVDLVIGAGVQVAGPSWPRQWAFPTDCSPTARCCCPRESTRPSWCRARAFRAG